MMVKKILAIGDSVGDVVEKPSGISLEDLALQAEKNDTAGQAETERAEAKSAVQETNTLAAEIEDALNMAAPFAEAGMWWLTAEKFKQLWGAETRKKIAAAAAAVMLKHGWNLSTVLEKYAPYIALGMAFAPPVMATVQAYKQATAKPAPGQGAQNAATT